MSEEVVKHPPKGPKIKKRPGGSKPETSGKTPSEKTPPKPGSGIKRREK